MSRAMVGPDDIVPLIRPNDAHMPRTRMVCVENTCNLRGGRVWSVDEQRDAVYLAAIRNEGRVYEAIAAELGEAFGGDADGLAEALRILELDRALCPRTGSERFFNAAFDYDVQEAHDKLSAMEAPELAAQETARWIGEFHNPGGVGDILVVADGGSWLKGSIVSSQCDRDVILQIANA